MKGLWNFLRFILAGLLTAAVGEWQFSVFLRDDLANFLGSLAFNTLYLSGVYLVTRLWLALGETPEQGRRWMILAYTGLFGLSGLMVEWFLIGNSPWGNPDASQTGMFAYWACMALVPLTFLLRKHRLQRFIFLYGLVYTLLALAGQLIPAYEWRFAFHIYLVIFGYLGLMSGVVWGYMKRRHGH